MALIGTLSNMRYWIILGVAMALLIGPIGDFSSNLLIIVLIIQMTLSMDGLTLNSENIKKNKRPILYSVIGCFGISAGVTLIIGSFFISGHQDLWNGWVLLAAVPCAVSCVTMSFYLKGNTTMCVLALAVVYFLALALTPLITLVMLGEAVSVLKILSYVILFVVVPMAASFPLKKIKIDRTTRMITVNIMMFLMVFLALGANRDFLSSEPVVVILVIIACIVRVFVVGFLMTHIFKKKGSNRENALVYIPMSVWKNSGLATTLCFVLFGSAAGAALPCAISLLVEVLWFASISSYIEKIWPSDNPISAVNG
ncbi:sodium bile acid symporter family protein [Candidatus Methanoplasma termitum]|uniref:Sodium bile acid symporter family protein n=1 Tax=Candidatus Methanoplasma termitum TaxID=1577791 RepID=A0A0A7LDE9_9ARCH|nr:Na+-dependent transporter [Candidatus Methanoplasma termitum]AIZ56347.1 sodium bile acid symporter family protein [Candidatus Methanoplasma termitum]